MDTPKALETLRIGGGLIGAFIDELQKNLREEETNRQHIGFDDGSQNIVDFESVLYDSVLKIEERKDVGVDTMLTVLSIADKEIKSHTYLLRETFFDIIIRYLKVSKALIEREENNQTVIEAVDAVRRARALSADGALTPEAGARARQALAVILDIAASDQDLARAWQSLLDVTGLDAGAAVQPVIGAHTARLSAEPKRQDDLPKEAPAIWRTAKRSGDNPPDFIKRHYEPWLRQDGTGLTRPDIKRLDPSLYTALANWLRKPENQLPDDCPVPTKSEALKRAPVRDEGFEPSEEMRSWWRAEGARQRARERQQRKR